MNKDTHILVGHIHAVFGIKGWLKIYSHCRPKEQILDYINWQLCSQKSSEEYKLEDGKAHGNGIIAKLKDIDDRNQAEVLKGADIWVAKTDLAPLEDGEYYWFELEGLCVLTLQGEKLGYVQSLMETGANDVLLVQDDGSQQEILIPYIHEEVIKEVNLSQKTIIVDWLPDY